MRNNTLPRIVQVLGFILAMALLPSAHALQITLNLPDCATGQALAFNASTNVLSCGGTAANTPSGCSITAVPTSSTQSPLAANTPVTLTALCTAGTTPINYEWSLGVTQPAINVTPATTTTYTVTPRNADGPGTTFSATVYIVGVTTAPSNCSVVQSPDPVNAGTSATLSATCSSGSAPTSCAWSISSATTCSVTITAPAASTPYSVTASNSAGPAPVVNATLNVQTQVDAGQNFCTGADQIINIAWPAAEQSQFQTRGFTQNSVAFKLTIPATFSPALNPLHTGYISMVEVPGAIRTSREVTISRNSCDFTLDLPILRSSGGTSPAFSFAVDNATGFGAIGASFNLQPGAIYYVNVRNQYRGATTCPTGKNCDILFNYKTPNSY